MSGQRDNMGNKGGFNKGQGQQDQQKKDKNIGGGFGQGQQRQDQQRPGQNQPGSTNKGWGSTSGTNLPKDQNKEKGKDKF